MELHLLTFCTTCKTSCHLKILAYTDKSQRRTEETHTKWHVDQSVRAAEDKAPGQSILTLLPTALDVMSVASDETTCAADYRNTISTTSVRYAYRIGNLDFHWTDPRNTNLWTTKFTYSAQPRQDLPKHIKTIVEDLNKVIQLGSPLLTVLYEWHDGVGSVVTYAEKLLQKVVSLWYLCATIGGTLSEEMIQPSLEQIGGLSINVSEAGSRIELMESTARQFGIMKGPQVNLPGPDQEGALSIQEFVTESWEQHGIPLDNIISLLIYWDFILRVKQLPSPTDYDPDEKPKPEPEPKEGAAWIDLSKHEGLTVNRQDNVIGSDGLPIARPVEGNPEKITGRTITIGNNGSLFDSNTKFIGRCELIPENEPRSMKKRPFTGLEGLVVIQGGLVEDAELNIVGKVVEGDPKKLLGSVVDEDGDIIDISGEVRGRCKRLSPDDQIITGNKKQHPPSSNPRVAGGSDTIDDNDSSRLLNRLPHKQLVERSASGSAEYALPSFDSFGKTTQNGLKEKEIAHPVAAGIGAAPLGAGALATSRDESVQEIATIETPAAEEQLFSVSSKKSKKDKKKRQSTFNDFDNEQTASPAPEEFRDVTTSDSVPLVDDDNTEMPHERQEAVTAEQEEQLFEFSRKKSKKDKKKKRRSTFDDFDTVPTTSTDDLGAAVPVTMAKLQRDIDETPAPEEEEAFATPNRKSKKEKKKKRQSTFDNEIGEPVALSAQDQL